jgi:hypothetical protein
MSVTYSGIDLVCLFLIAFLATSFTRGGKCSRRRIPLYILLVIVVWALYVGLWTILAENSIALGLNNLEPATGPLDFRALLFAALLSIYMPAYRRLRDGDGAAPTGRRAKLALASAALCLAAYSISFAVPTAPPEAVAGKRVVFWDSGIDFTVPVHGQYGLDRVGMFGFLPQYLEATGYICDRTYAIGDASLETADVLVIINPMSTPDAESLDAIHEFVERGGGLLAVGDHTGTLQIREPLNAILAPAGISYNFDSAIPFQSLWPNAFVTRRGPVFAGVLDEQIQVVVGASLALDRRARPLLIGKSGYSDAGDKDNAADGFLGDMQFARGERVGDLVLAAESGYGAGKFLAFGDTSFLQNLSLAHSYPLIDNIFAHLANLTDGGAAPGDASTGGPSAPMYTASCLIDAAHLPSFKTDKSGDAADGFTASVIRAGMIPYVNRDPDLSAAMEATRDLKLIVLAEPAAELSAAEKASLLAFAENGGTIMLFGTYRSPAATRSLFSSFGFSFENVPVGRVSPTRDPEMAFWNACPLRYAPVAGASGAYAESLLDIWGYDVIMLEHIGRGRVYAFGDGDFIKNKNLENIDAYRKGNIDFIADLLGDIRESE